MRRIVVVGASLGGASRRGGSAPVGVQPRVDCRAPVPSFWTDRSIHPKPLTDRAAASVEVVDGDPFSDAFVAEYRLRGRLVGAVGAGSAAALLPYRRELAESMKASLVA